MEDLSGAFFTLNFIRNKYNIKNQHVKHTHKI